LKKKTDKNPQSADQSIFIHAYSLFTEKCSPKSTIYPGIFLGRALWADSVSPPINTVASHDQIKPIRIGENLVVNYPT